MVVLKNMLLLLLLLLLDPGGGFRNVLGSSLFLRRITARRMMIDQCTVQLYVCKKDCLKITEPRAVTTIQLQQQIDREEAKYAQRECQSHNKVIRNSSRRSQNKLQRGLPSQQQQPVVIAAPDPATAPKTALQRGGGGDPRKKIRSFGSLVIRQRLGRFYLF